MVDTSAQLIIQHDLAAWWLDRHGACYMKISNQLEIPCKRQRSFTNRSEHANEVRRQSRAFAQRKEMGGWEPSNCPTAMTPAKNCSRGSASWPEPFAQRWGRAAAMPSSI